MVSSSNITSAIELNLFTLPLTGRSLIEASAGTGKTYSLSFIYLRLLLGIGDKGYSRALTVEEILVVTFTKAATEELRYRIRQNIYQLRKACLQGYHDDVNYQQLLKLIEDKESAAKRLYYAEQSMDQAAIFTIHSFCQRLLTTYAFEAGSLFQKVLLKDETNLYLQKVQDFWRDYFTPMSADLAKIIWQNWADPQALLADIMPYINRDIPENIQLSSTPLLERINDFHRCNIYQINTIKSEWLANVDDIHMIIMQSGVNNKSYAKNHLARWLTTVTQWAQSPTEDYTIPVKELSKFSQTELNNKTERDKIAPSHPLFSQIEQFIAQSFSLKDTFLFDITKLISQDIQKEKGITAQMGFDDLLTDLKQALYSQNGSYLVKQIVAQYPVAMIDEFQDTDPVQYQIFDRIYQDRENTLLLFIGDPKQAIYSFRGADIFTYIKAKLSVDHRFTMTTNWRSIPSMVAAVNNLFSLKNDPFIFQQIPFIPMHSAEANQYNAFLVNDRVVDALSCYLLPDCITSNSDYLNYAAQCCAEQIAQWLLADSYFINKLGQKKAIISSDIAVLVRTAREAEIIQQALIKRHIKSVYISNHRSVFKSTEAKEVLRILQAVMMPTDENYLRSALATCLIGASMADIDQLSYDQQVLENLVDEFNTYQTIWQNNGILVMLRYLMNRRQIAENLLMRDEGERTITNFMHLGELLQEISQELDTPHAIIRWLNKQINEPDYNITNHEQRLESDENLINIITIHKSKGLEYPIVFLPFIGTYRESDSHIYHERQTYSTHYAFELTPQIKQLIEQERLAEDVRLLYVALTRSIYHCSFVLAGLKKGRAKQLSLNQSAIGHLLLEASENDYSALQQKLMHWRDLVVIDVKLPVPVTFLRYQTSELNSLVANLFTRKLDYSWRVTSYSGLQQSSSYRNHTTDFINDIKPAFDSEVLSDTNQTNDVGQFIGDDMVKDESINRFDIHHFPKGAMVGTVLHECFEIIDFKQPDLPSITSQIIDKLNLPDDWRLPLMEWLTMVCSTPLMDGLSLSQISNEQRLNELQFFLPIRHQVIANDLDRICKQFDALSNQCPPLDFMTVQGMLKGYIDMIFMWQGKYYIVDYKSNYLGASAEDYTQMAMHQAMCEHRYDLQYQLYSLALHRYLRSRIANYQYPIHLGGVYYLFIRGMSTQHPQNGVFYTKPDVKLIDELDHLFG